MAGPAPPTADAVGYTLPALRAYHAALYASQSPSGVFHTGPLFSITFALRSFIFVSSHVPAAVSADQLSKVCGDWGWATGVSVARVSSSEVFEDLFPVLFFPGRGLGELAEEL